MLLTCLLSGIFDGATITTIMGIVTLTILLSSGMRSEHIVKILLLLVVATNIGGVWFVLGEPTNILAASKLGLSPFFFLRYSLPFALPAAGLCAFAAWRIVRRYPKIKSDRPETEVLLEGLSLRRTHEGTGTLADTLRDIGNVEIRSYKELQRIVEEEGLPDFAAALKAGIPQDKVYAALSVNLNSAELARGLIEYYHYRVHKDPMAEVVLGDLLLRVRDEYKARTSSRRLVIASGVVLVGLLIAHAFLRGMSTWAFFALAAIVGTALGGLASPIASVRAVIMATIVRRVARVGFGGWVRIAVWWFLILLGASSALLLGMHALGLPPSAPSPIR